MSWGDSSFGSLRFAVFEPKIAWTVEEQRVALGDPLPESCGEARPAGFAACSASARSRICIKMKRRAVFGFDVMPKARKKSLVGC